MRTAYDPIAMNAPPFKLTARTVVRMIYGVFEILFMEVLVGPALDGLPKKGRKKT